MAASLTGNLVRRALKALPQEKPDSKTMEKVQKALTEEALKRVSAPGAAAVLISSLVAFTIISIGIEYCVRYVVGNLTIIEDVAHEQSAELELDGLLDNEEDKGELAEPKEGYDEDRVSIDAKVAVQQQQEDEEGERLTKSSKRAEEGRVRPQGAPITRTIIKTLRHLRSTYGISYFWNGFRGFWVWLILAGITDYSLSTFIPGLPSFVAGVLGGLLADLLFMPMHCAWTQSTIRAPRPDGVYRSTGHSLLSRQAVGVVAPVIGISRLPWLSTGLRNYFSGAWSRHLVLPTIRSSLVSGVAFELSGAIRLAYRNAAKDGNLDPMGPFIASVLGLTIVMLYEMVIGSLFIFPTYVALIRVEASLLPECDQAMVPLDRTFGGRAECWQSKELSWGRYILLNLSPFSAWKTFDREALYRVLKLYAKIFVFVICAAFLFVGLLILELRLFAGELWPLVLLGLGERLGF